LPVRPIRGIESHGMILLAESTDGTFHTIENEKAEPGAIVV